MPAFSRTRVLFFSLVRLMGLGSRILVLYKSKNLLTGTCKNIFGWLTLNNYSITSY